VTRVLTLGFKRLNWWLPEWWFYRELSTSRPLLSFDVTSLAFFVSGAVKDEIYVLLIRIAPSSLLSSRLAVILNVITRELSYVTSLKLSSVTVLLERLTGSQLVENFPAFYGRWMFIIAFTSACHLYRSWPVVIMEWVNFMWCVNKECVFRLVQNKTGA
jgi:hypothetical protein